MTDRASLVDRLRSLLGDAVLTDAVTLEDARSDKSGLSSAARPLAVVAVTSIEQIQAVMRFATEHRIPVVPRGAGTGLAGGATGGAGEIVLSTLKMDRVIEINAADQVAIVQPGILNDALNRLLAPLGLWFTPDPASKAISSIGGNIATNAGGLLCAKYGVTRDSVLGLTVVLADGRVLKLGHRTIKGVTGYDLTALFVGSEGTLGIIAEATLKLQPLPTGDVATIAAFFDTAQSAASAAAAITAGGVRPAALELIGESALEGISDYLGITRSRSGASLLVQTDGPGAIADAEVAFAQIREHGGDAEMTTDPETGERLFEMRRAFHAAMAARGTVLIEDVAVPRSALPAMFAALTSVEKRFGIIIPTVAHAGDGNLHPNFVFEGNDVPPVIWDAADAVFRACLELGGTLTGEHGVGILKRRWLADELGEDQVELQREVKRVFDPQGLLNPGKVF